MYMKSLVSLAVLGAMSAVATAGDLVVFDNPNESYTVDRLSKYGATISFRWPFSAPCPPLQQQEISWSLTTQTNRTRLTA